MRVVLQIGFKRNIKEGQLITATLNGHELDRDSYPGQFLTDMASRHKNSWYLLDLDCYDNDVITLSVKTGIRQKGSDERRTFTMTFRVNMSLNIMAIERNNVGMYGFPLLKGRVEEVTCVSKEDERHTQAETMLDDEGF